MAKARKCPACGTAMEEESCEGGNNYYCPGCDTEWVRPLNRGPLRKLDGATDPDPIFDSDSITNFED